jgi:hypothetical protein
MEETDSKIAMGTSTEKPNSSIQQHAADLREITKTPSVEKTGADDLDEAFRYLRDHTDEQSEGVDLKALRRKIDWHIVPIMFACYVLQFLDKVVINVSSSRGYGLGSPLISPLYSMPR